MNKLNGLLDKKNKLEEKIKTFGDLLSEISSTTDRKKSLWKEIYENAVSDRERASILFTEAFKSMGGGASDHTTMGSVMSKYLERMCKSNDQILQLADLISKAEKEDFKINPDDIFSKITEE
jgi:glucuronate isomerase